MSHSEAAVTHPVERNRGMGATTTVLFLLLAALAAACGGGDAAGDSGGAAADPAYAPEAEMLDAAGDVWIIDGGNLGVRRIGLGEDGRLARVALPSQPRQLAVTGDAAWIAVDDGRVGRVDAAGDSLTAMVTVGAGLSGIAATDDAVWVTSDGGGAERPAQVLRIDPAADSLVAAVPIGGDEGRFVGLAAHAGAVWVLTGDGTLARIDAARNRVADRTEVETGEAQRRSRLAVGPGAVYVASGSGQLHILDPQSLEERAQVPLGQDSVGAIVAGRDHVFVAFSAADRVLALDPTTGATDHVIEVDEPRKLQVAGGLLLVAGDDLLIFDGATGERLRKVPTGRLGDFAVRSQQAEPEP